MWPYATRSLTHSFIYPFTQFTYSLTHSFTQKTLMKSQALNQTFIYSHGASDPNKTLPKKKKNPKTDLSSRKDPQGEDICTKAAGGLLEPRESHSGLRVPTTRAQ